MKKNTVIIILSIVLLVFMGFTYKFFTDNAALQEQVNAHAGEIKNLSIKNSDLENGKLLLNEEISNLKDQIAELEETLVVEAQNTETLMNTSDFYKKKFNQAVEYNSSLSELLRNQVSMIDGRNKLSLRRADGQDYSEFVVAYIEKEKTLDDNLQNITDHLSKYVFGGLTLHYKGTTEIEGKQVAVVDVVDDQTADFTWVQDYFQGTTGGYITSLTLVESYLQRETALKNWIEGVKFTYNGQEGDFFDHVGLFREPYLRDKDYFDFDEQ